MSGYDLNEAREVRALIEISNATILGLELKLAGIEQKLRDKAELRVLEAQRDAQTWRPTDS